MKKFLFAVLFLSIAFAQSKFELKKVWESEPELKVCESVLFNDGNVYVSCINGKPSEKNGKGYIAKLNSDGEIIKKEWANGLNAPKGMSVFNDFLIVTDIHRIAKIDLKTGKVIKFYDIEGSSFLNDVAVTENGVFYISDAGAGKIFKLENETITEVFKNPAKYPNGMYIENNILYAGGSSKSKEIYSYDLKTGKNLTNYKSDSGIDGLKLIDKDNFLVSDWMGRTYIVSKKAEFIELINTTSQKVFAADLEYIKSKELVIIPTFFDNRVVAYKLIRK